MILENIADSRIGYMISDILQRALNSVVSPTPILLGHSNDKQHYLLSQTRTPCCTLPTIAIVPLFRDQLPMPTQNRIRRHNRNDFMEGLSA